MMNVFKSKHLTFVFPFQVVGNTDIHKKMVVDVWCNKSTNLPLHIQHTNIHTHTHSTSYCLLPVCWEIHQFSFNLFWTVVVVVFFLPSSSLPSSFSPKKKRLIYAFAVDLLVWFDLTWSKVLIVSQCLQVNFYIFHPFVQSKVKCLSSWFCFCLHLFFGFFLFVQLLYANQICLFMGWGKNVQNKNGFSKICFCFAIQFLTARTVWTGLTCFGGVCCWFLAIPFRSAF